ncbi:hypothetical protein [uncultured Lactobacillus sp.]|mgnify:CR=1 FL=1|uniref:hypothetical protein n=1 Tax=uncultured Lactobacillus sp. TaxID=153152 RepID=UPI00259B39AE|nr:hypothetical protein [uncultured Lactobacillus sp.]
MSVTMEFNLISNQKSLVAVYIQGRPLYWEAHLTPVEVMDPKTGSTEIRSDVKAKSLLRMMLDRYCDVDDQTELEDALKQLKKVLSEDYNKAMQAEETTKQIAKKMANMEYADLSATKSNPFL